MWRVNLQCIFQNNPSIHSVKVHLWDIPMKYNCQCSPILRVSDEIWGLFLNARFSCHPSSHSSEDDCNQELHIGRHFLYYLFTSPMLSKCSRMIFAEDFPITFFFLLLVCVENIYNGVQLRDSDCPSIQLPRKQTCGYPAFPFITEDAIYTWFPPMSPLQCILVKRKGHNNPCSIIWFAVLRCYLFAEYSGYKVSMHCSWWIAMPRAIQIAEDTTKRIPFFFSFFPHLLLVVSQMQIWLDSLKYSNLVIPVKHYHCNNYFTDV